MVEYNLIIWYGIALIVAGIFLGDSTSSGMALLGGLVMTGYGVSVMLTARDKDKLEAAKRNYKEMIRQEKLK